MAGVSPDGPATGGTGAGLRAGSPGGAQTSPDELLRRLNALVAAVDPAAVPPEWQDELRALRAAAVPHTLVDAGAHAATGGDTVDDLPAWSEQFAGDGPGPAPHLALRGDLDRDWAFGDRSGRGVRVAVIDSGIEAGHPLVGAVDVALMVELDPDAPDGVRFVAGPHDDVCGHGTACAGIIRQLAPEVELISIRVLNADLRCSAWAFAHALEWCIDNDVDVVNLSLSTSNDDYYETFHDLVDRATFARMHLVSAMNNERRTSIPSEFAGVFSVACAPGTDRERFLCNPTGPAEWGAAGIDVEVAWSGDQVVTASGNSFAAPVIAGQLARIVGAHPGITPWQARTVLAAVADNRP
jgi:subtilisin